jgi:hypothetical protein
LDCFCFVGFLSDSDGRVGCDVARHLSELTADRRHSLISQRFAGNYLFVGGVFFFYLIHADI